MASSQIMTRLHVVNKVLTKLGIAGSFLGGGFGIYESGKLFVENQSTKFGYNIGLLPPLGAFMGFAIGYTSPVMVPYILYKINYRHNEYPISKS